MKRRNRYRRAAAVAAVFLLCISEISAAAGNFLYIQAADMDYNTVSDIAETESETPENEPETEKNEQITGHETEISEETAEAEKGNESETDTESETSESEPAAEYESVSETEETSAETDAEEEPGTEITDAETDIEEEPETVPTAEETVEGSTEPEPETETEQETETEPEEKEPIFSKIAGDSLLTEAELSALDFSSKRLLVAGAEIIDPEDILSEYDGVYLLQYADETLAKYAYSYYFGKAAFVLIDSVVTVADGNQEAVGSGEMTENDNPFTELQEAVTENPYRVWRGTIALIDTGVNGSTNVTEAVSMIGDDLTDLNGHGTRMAELITSQDPDAKILSIKALGANGQGDMSAVYAAIQYAIEKNVSIINLSLSAVKKADSEMLKAAIDEALAKGIKVVAAAGNNGSDAKYFIPGGYEEVITVGACDEKGTKIPTSNYGELIDFNVTAQSTSEAAAIYSGLLSAGKGEIDYRLVFPRDYTVSAGPEIRHQITFFNYETGDPKDAVDVSFNDHMTSTLAGDSIKTVILFNKEDAYKVKDLGVYVNFMNVEKERNITAECVYDHETMTVTIPAAYKDEALTVRWYMPNASYIYTSVVEFPLGNTPSEFYTSYNAYNATWTNWSAFLSQFPQQEALTITNNDFASFSVGSTFTATGGYTAVLDGAVNAYITAADGKTMGFANTFTAVKNDSTGKAADFLVNIGTKATYNCRVSAAGSMQQVTANWLYGTCLNDELSGTIPMFAASYNGNTTRIRCCAKDETNHKAYFFYQVVSPYAQYNAGYFGVTFKEESFGYLKVHKEAAESCIPAGTAPYSFKGIQFKVYTDEACKKEAKDYDGKAITLTADKNGVTGTVKLKVDPKNGTTFYVREVKSSLSGTAWVYNSTPTKVTVTTKNTSSSPKDAGVKNHGNMDPVGVLLRKVDKETGEVGRRVG